MDHDVRSRSHSSPQPTRPSGDPPSAAPSCAACWRSGWSGCGCGNAANLLTILEKFAYTLRPTDAVMQLQLTGDPHDDPRSHPRAPGRAEDRDDAGPEGAVARPVRQRAAAVQPPLPGEPAGLPHPGTGLWRAEARDDPAAGAAGRGTRRRRPQEEPHPRRHHAHRRHAADPRVAGRRARRHRHRGRLRMAGAALQVAVGHRPRHHRHALERLGVLRAQEPGART
jgi:hypothetical protein